MNGKMIFNTEELKAMPSSTDWGKLKALDEAGEEPDLSNEQEADDKAFAQARNKKRRGERSFQKAPLKCPINIRLSADVLAYFKAKGKGWQTLIDETLRKAAGL